MLSYCLEDAFSLTLESLFSLSKHPLSPLQKQIVENLLYIEKAMLYVY